MAMDLAALAYGGLAIFAAGLLRGFTGFGFAIAAVPLLSLVIAPIEAVAIVALLQVGIGLTDIRQALPKTDWPSIGPVVVAMALATPFGFALLTILSPGAARLAIAATLAVATALLASGWRFAHPPGRAVALAVGTVSGLFNGLAAMPGPPVVAYCLSLSLDARTTRASLISYFLMTSGLALAAAVASGLLHMSQILAAAIGFPMLFLGNAAGAFLFRRAADALWRRIVLIALAGLTLVVAARALIDLT
jgi:uncharacterized membrane protein YfcA